MPRMEQYEQLARDLAVFIADFHDPMMMQRHLTTWFASGSRTPDLALADAKQMVAHSYGLRSWESFCRDRHKTVSRHSLSRALPEPSTAVLSDRLEGK